MTLPATFFPAVVAAIGESRTGKRRKTAPPLARASPDKEGTKGDDEPTRKEELSCARPSTRDRQRYFFSFASSHVARASARVASVAGSFFSVGDSTLKVFSASSPYRFSPVFCHSRT